MALAGSGAVAIWHDIVPEGRAAFYDWHGREHMPERAAIPGFLCGRRYVAVEGLPEYFNLYETRDPSVVSGSEYLAKLNAPTSWTVSTVKHFRGVSRSLCAVPASFGEGQGGLMATYRYDVRDEDGAQHRQRMAARLSALAAEPGIAGAHLLVADTEASAVDTAEKKVRKEKNAIPRWIVLVESWDDEGPFVAAARAFAADAVFSGVLEAPEWAVYRLQNTRNGRK